VSHAPLQPIRLTRPARGDFDPAAADYVGLASEISDAVSQLTSQRDAVNRRFSVVTEVGGGHRYAPGKWTVREVLGHLCDAERMFAYRLLRIARGDETPLAGFDENTYVPAACFESRALGDLTEEWTATRNATVALVRGLPDDAWTRKGTANGKNVTSAALAYIILGHVEHHLRVLRDRYGV
jgi:DinB superfamily